MIQDSDFPTDPKELPAFYAAHIARETGIPFNAALGVVQRLQAESGSNFSQLQEHKPVVPGSRGGAGIAMWTGPRRTDAESATSGIGGLKSPSANLAYLIADLKQNYQPLLQALQDPKMTTQGAYNAFTQGYEYNKGPYAAKNNQPVKMAKGPDPLDFETPAEAPAQPTQTAGPGGAQTASVKPTEAVAPPAPAVAAKPSSDPLDFENTAPAAPAATSASTPSPDNPNEGKGVAATVPQGSAGNDVRVGLGQAGGFLSNVATDPVGTLLLKPAVAVGTLAYNHIAPLFGGSPASPETVNRLMTEAGNTGPFQMTRPAVAGTNPETSTSAANNQSAMSLTGGNPDLPVAVPGLRTVIGAGIPGAVLGGIAGPSVATGAAMGAAGAGASNLAPMIARPEDQPGIETLLGAAGGAGTGRALKPSEVPIRPYTAQTALEGQKAGGPEMRPGQLTTDVGAKKADLRDNVDATNQQIVDLTKAITSKAGLPNDELNSAYVDKLLDHAGDRLNTIAAKTNFTAGSGNFIDDVAKVESKFSATAEATNPNIAAEGRKLVSNLLEQATKNGQLTGADYQNLTAKASELKQAAQKPGQIGQLAQGLLKALNDELERSADPKDVQEIRDARQQYAIGKRLEPMVNDTTGLVDPQRFAREFGGDQTELGAIARQAGLLPKPGITGGVAAPSMSMMDLARTAGNRAALGALSGSGLIAFHDQALALAHAMATNPMLMAAAGGAATMGLLYKGAANAARAYQNRPAAQRAMITRAAMGLQGPPGANMLLPGVAGSESNQ